MGGDYYDRDIISTTEAYSNASNTIICKNKLQKTMDPKRFDDEHLKCDKEDPIVFALDVTGSMGDWSKIIYDKMPMFYGQIKQKNYLKDPSISICGIGDYTSDESPLQVSEFAQGSNIDVLLSDLYLEGGGGGGYQESYELAAYFYTKQVKLLGHEFPFFFITGDEGFRDNIKKKYISEYLGLFCKEDVRSDILFQELMLKYNVFLIKKPYDSPNENKVRDMWENAIGKERILDIQNAKACIDICLGAIAITSGKRTLDEYIKDMQERGQSKNRQEEIRNALFNYWNKVKNNLAIIVKKTINPEDKLLNNVNTNGILDFRKIIEEANKVRFENLSEEKKKYIEALSKMKATFKDSIPNEFFCPITGEIFFEPVMTEDGQTYEKSAIEEWLKFNNKSPLTGAILSTKNLIQNFVMKKLINSFYEMKKNEL